jgi:hypothetical protein
MTIRRDATTFDSAVRPLEADDLGMLRRARFDHELEARNLSRPMQDAWLLALG